jgi:hypothetical protein
VLSLLGMVLTLIAAQLRWHVVFRSACPVPDAFRRASPQHTFVHRRLHGLPYQLRLSSAGHEDLDGNQEDTSPKPVTQQGDADEDYITFTCTRQLEDPSPHPLHLLDFAAYLPEVLGVH